MCMGYVHAGWLHGGVAMSQRNAILHTAARTYQAILTNPIDSPALMRALLVDLLSPQQKQILEFCKSVDIPVTSPNIELAFGLSQPHASSLLKELWQVGLLKRNRVVNDETRFYEYRINEIAANKEMD